MESYGPFLYQIARAYTVDNGAAADCYVHICEQLAHNRFKRLLKFNPKEHGSFTTWLRVVARNLCFDWPRSQSGRYRRGLQGENLQQILTDGCAGLAAAIQTVYPRVLYSIFQRFTLEWKTRTLKLFTQAA